MEDVARSRLSERLIVQRESRISFLDCSHESRERAICAAVSAEARASARLYLMMGGNGVLLCSGSTTNVSRPLTR